MRKFQYPFRISRLPAEEGGGYLIEFPDLPGCLSDGEAISEAIANGQDASFCWIETAQPYFPAWLLCAFFRFQSINDILCSVQRSIIALTMLGLPITTSHLYTLNAPARTIGAQA